MQPVVKLLMKVAREEVENVLAHTNDDETDLFDRAENSKATKNTTQPKSEPRSSALTKARQLSFKTQVTTMDKKTTERVMGKTLVKGTTLQYYMDNKPERVLMRANTFFEKNKNKFVHKNDDFNETPIDSDAVAIGDPSENNKAVESAKVNENNGIPSSDAEAEPELERPSPEADNQSHPAQHAATQNLITITNLD